MAVAAAVWDELILVNQVWRRKELSKWAAAVCDAKAVNKGKGKYPKYSLLRKTTDSSSTQVAKKAQLALSAFFRLFLDHSALRKKAQLTRRKNK